MIPWRNEPMVHAGATQRLDTSTFPTTGVAVVGWTLLGLSAGLLAGILWRRVVPAMATSFAAWFGLAYPRFDAATALVDPAHDQGRRAGGRVGAL